MGSWAKAAIEKTPSAQATPNNFVLFIAINLCPGILLAIPFGGRKFIPYERAFRFVEPEKMGPATTLAEYNARVPMKPKLVTLDAAGTLVRVDWSPAKLAKACIERLDLRIPTDQSSELFSDMLRNRWPEYMKVNLLRSEEAGDEFWRKLCVDWVAGVGLSSSVVNPFVDAVWAALYGQDQMFFSLYPDSLPAVRGLRAAGVTVAVISNWDYSLHRILKMLGIHAEFDLVIASLEEGFEKPDPRIFHLALDHFQVPPHEAMHVGDDVGDDHRGAQAVGMRSLILDRARKDASEPYIADLRQIWETRAWTT